MHGPAISGSWKTLSGISWSQPLLILSARPDLPEHIRNNISAGLTEEKQDGSSTVSPHENGCLRDISAMSWPDLEKAYVNALMEKFNWNITWAARASGINRSTFASRMRKLNVRRGAGLDL